MHVSTRILLSGLAGILFFLLMLFGCPKKPEPFDVDAGDEAGGVVDPQDTDFCVEWKEKLAKALEDAAFWKDLAATCVSRKVEVKNE